MEIRVFIIDDHALVRTGLNLILSGENDIEVVGDAESGEEALPLIRKLKPDVVLCDLHLPGLSGLEVTERIVKGEQGSRVIIVSVLQDGPMPKRLLEAGASGYVLKSGADTDIVDAVRAAMRGDSHLYPSAVTTLVRDYVEHGGRGEEQFDVLTPRELEVLKLIAEAFTSKQIADELFISIKTVDRHRQNILDKLGMRDRVELTRYAIRRGLIQP